jgi:hypothetical protein
VKLANTSSASVMYSLLYSYSWSNSAAASDAAKISVVGSLELVSSTASRSHGAGRMEVLVRKFVGAAALVTRPAISYLMMHKMIISYTRVATSGRVRRDAVSTMKATALRPEPIRQAYLFTGLVSVPPRFLKVCMIIILLFALTARMVMLASLVIIASFVALGRFPAQAALKTRVSLLPASLEG